MKTPKDSRTSFQKDLEAARKLNKEKDFKIKKLEAALNDLKKVLKSKANISQALEKATESLKEKEKEIEKYLIQMEEGEASIDMT